MQIRLWIPGDPIPQRRPRACAMRVGSTVRARVYSDQDKEQDAYRMAIISRLPVGWSAIQGPVALDCRFYFAVPRSAPKKKQAVMIAGEVFHTVKPDGSNLLKFLEDAANGVLWRDDRQIVRAGWCKAYGTVAGTEIVVAEV